MTSEHISIYFNGHKKDIPHSSTIQDLLLQLDISPENIAIAINNDVISKSNYSEYKIQSEDWIEMIQPLAGG